jgi:hypothetical protein
MHKGTWNVRTMNEASMLEQIKIEQTQHKYIGSK